jgi:chemotaxis signal transduction protein
MATHQPSLTATTRGGELRYGFEVGGLRLVPAAGVLTEMVAEARVFPIPKAAGALSGVLNLRGTIVPLFDLQTLAQVAADIRPSQRRALVFDRDEQRAGFLLDAVPELVALVAAPANTPHPAGALAEFLTRAWSRADQPQQIWWQLDHHKAFNFLARSKHQ